MARCDAWLRGQLPLDRVEDLLAVVRPEAPKVLGDALGKANPVHASTIAYAPMRVKPAARAGARPPVIYCMQGLLRGEAEVAPHLVEHLDLERHRRLRRVP